MTIRHILLHNVELWNAERWKLRDDILTVKHVGIPSAGYDTGIGSGIVNSPRCCRVNTPRLVWRTGAGADICTNGRNDSTREETDKYHLSWGRIFNVGCWGFLSRAVTCCGVEFAGYGCGRNMEWTGVRCSDCGGSGNGERCIIDSLHWSIVAFLGKPATSRGLHRQRSRPEDGEKPINRQQIKISELLHDGGMGIKLAEERNRNNTNTIEFPFARMLVHTYRSKHQMPTQWHSFISPCVTSLLNSYLHATPPGEIWQLWKRQRLFH